MALEGEMPVEGPWVDRLCGLEGVQVDIDADCRSNGRSAVVENAVRDSNPCRRREREAIYRNSRKLGHG
jgi:hypothetical protein